MCKIYRNLNPDPAPAALPAPPPAAAPAPPIDPMAIIRAIVEAIQSAPCAPSFAQPAFPCGAPFMGVPFQNCLPPAFNGCFPGSAAFLGCAPAPQPSQIKKGKEWKQGMIDAAGKDIPKPPREGSNAHFDKNGNFKKWTSPLTFDLDGNGSAGTTTIAGGRKGFDLDGDGKLEDTAWAEKGDGVLAFDRDGDGKAGTSGKELFGNAADTGDGKQHANGFDALRSLAQQKLGEDALRDGKLDAKEIAALERTVAEGGAGLTMLVDGKQVKPTDLGISELSLGYREAGDNADANGNLHRQVGQGFVRNGRRAAVDDVWFAHT